MIGVEGYTLKVAKLKNWKVEEVTPSTFQLYKQAMNWLFPLALHGHRVDLDVEHNETPQLIKLEAHPELFRF
jgi:hypothetical protein